LRRRLGADRRVFVWTHPSLPGEPLVALHVALCAAMPTRMADILGDPRLPPPPAAAAGGDHQLPPPANGGPDPTAAVLYSISSTQPGLAGIDLGNNLIKRAAAALRAEAPSLRTLCTLSPLPGFAAWLDAQLAAAAAGGDPRRRLLSAGEAAALAAAAGEARELGAAAQAQLLRGALRGGRWPSSPDLVAALRAPLLRLAARYLAREKRRGRALDAVANFHLRNGAALGAVLFAADASAEGMARSHGVMASYSYDLELVEARNRRYLVGGHVAAEPQVLALLECE
jgi:hypothetical protein